jgi:hypothetical protein
MPTLQEVIHHFDPISLAEMDRVELLDRMDTKYVFGSVQLPELLATLRPEYRILEVEGRRGTDYRSLYFDTAELRHYHEHHNGHAFRSKVRYREYVGSGLAFLEVKRKTGRGGTNKKRIRVDGIPMKMTPEQRSFVTKASTCAEPLLPQLWNHFTRITLVHRSLQPGGRRTFAGGHLCGRIEGGPRRPELALRSPDAPVGRASCGHEQVLHRPVASAP